ncbi:trypsin Inhibitor like cysteine rich domain protein [Oesophagostomum dentatum]|uniref:Trypsin Inhibitor like cysteine rich domain protein n=1 Tax=Oesophagostomum dentatum TaxID=61180 RepID=A0A0B1TK79_OESDE|nr:trypsin Inhibitor like cysteine rich domain protein [Oesophagostomum dentatum]
MLGVLAENTAVSSGTEENECPENEEMKKCGPICEPTCVRMYPMTCLEECIMAGCSCKKGFYRNSEGNCVSNCTADPCNEHAVRMACAPTEGCEQLCLPLPSEISLPCENKCIENGCACEDGYVRIAPGGICISDEMCSDIKAAQEQFDDHSWWEAVNI